MKQYELILKNPADAWDNRTPIGNGALGAMIEGGISQDGIQLNEERIWSGKYIEPNSPNFMDKINHIRKLILDGHEIEADRYAVEELKDDFKRIKSYETAGELKLSFSHRDNCENYIRKIDLNRGVATVSFKVDGVTYTREYFASYPKNLIAMRLTSDGGKFDFDATLERELLTVIACGDTLCADGTPQIDGRPFNIRVKFSAVDGIISSINGKISVKATNCCYIFLTIKTDGDAVLPETLDYDALKAEHIADFSELMCRSDITLPDSGVDTSLPTNERLRLMRENGTADNKLVELYFAFGKYLLISSSRKGTLPANLQGVWCGEYKAPWNSDYHTNINLQMNYWHAEVTNISECAEPLFDYINDYLLENGKNTADKFYNCRGAVVHHLSDIYGYTAPADGVWGLWPLGGAWLCYHLYEHYLYTGDLDFLRERAYPYIAACTRFFLDYMFEHDGMLLSGPSTSPENRYLIDGQQGFITLSPSMDIEIIGGLFDFYLEVERLLDIDSEQAEECKLARAKMPQLRVGKYGQLMEWLHDYDEAEPGHRHISHLFGVYPGASITDETPELFKAARVTLDRRLSHGGGHTGWSAAWLIALFARLCDGNSAYGAVEKILTKSTKDNLLDSHPPFQIDGNFGATAAIAEMLMQSHNGRIRILPALPKNWKDGCFERLMARGGIEVSATWTDCKVVTLTLKAKYDTVVKIEYDGEEKCVSLKAGVLTEIA